MYWVHCGHTHTHTHTAVKYSAEVVVDPDRARKRCLFLFCFAQNLEPEPRDVCESESAWFKTLLSSEWSTRERYPAGAAVSAAGGGLGGLSGLSGLRGRVRHPRMILPVLAPKQKAAATKQ